MDRWMDSMGEADLVVVLDTGSKDGTVERLRPGERRLTVERILPWRLRQPVPGTGARRMWTCVSVPTWMR